MRKFKPVTVFLGLHAVAQLKVIADASLRVTNPPQQRWSVSKLVRAAVRDFIDGLQEWEDAVNYAQAAHKPQAQQPKPNLNSVARQSEMNAAV